MDADLGIDRILHVKIPVTDVAASARWYSRLLDMRLAIGVRRRQCSAGGRVGPARHRDPHCPPRPCPFKQQPGPLRFRPHRVRDEVTAGLGGLRRTVRSLGGRQHRRAPFRGRRGHGCCRPGRNSDPFPLRHRASAIRGSAEPSRDYYIHALRRPRACGHTDLGIVIPTTGPRPRSVPLVPLKAGLRMTPGRLRRPTVAASAIIPRRRSSGRPLRRFLRGWR